MGSMHEVLPSKDVYVATDSDDIKSYCSALGINTLMTSNNCMTGLTESLKLQNN